MIAIGTFLRAKRVQRLWVKRAYHTTIHRPKEEIVIMRLAGKVALISGGARGMGAEEERLFAREGAKVVVDDLVEAEGKAVDEEIPAAAGDARFVSLDVTSEDDWARAVETTERLYRRLDILVNNAGIGGGRRLEETTLEEWERTMAVNATGVFLGSRAVMPAMRRAGGRSIANLESQFGRV